MKCLECGGDVPQPTRRRCGQQPRFCSETCRLARKAKTHRRWVEDNRERHGAVKKKNRESYKEANPEYFKRYYADNKERRRSETRAWYAANAEHHAQVVRRYVEHNKEWALNIGKKAASKRRSIKERAFVEDVDPKVVFHRDGGICRICMKSVDLSAKWEVDHVIPISKGGAHSYDNVQLTHRRCNRSKGATLPKGQPTLFQIVPS